MAKTVAYIGLSGPFGYDYRNQAPRLHNDGSDSPNPVLENVLGLLVCYDELVFLAPQFCPADMRALPYVRFLTDDDDVFAVAAGALADFDRSAHPDWPESPSFERFGAISEEMRGAEPDLFAIDNHARTVMLGQASVMGNGMDLSNAMRDLWVVAALGLSHADVIISSPMQSALAMGMESEASGGHYFSPEKRAAAGSLVSLQVPNFLGPSGSYHEALEAIRDRRDVAEFRQFLIEYDAPVADGEKLAGEISRAAFDTMDDIALRFLNPKHLFRSVGVPAARGVLNAVVPHLGTAAGLAIEAPFQLEERRFKGASRWAPFVVALNRPVR